MDDDEDDGCDSVVMLSCYVVCVVVWDVVCDGECCGKVKWMILAFATEKKWVPNCKKCVIKRTTKMLEDELSTKCKIANGEYSTTNSIEGKY